MNWNGSILNWIFILILNPLYVCEDNKNLQTYTFLHTLRVFVLHQYLVAGIINKKTATKNSSDFNTSAAAQHTSN